MSDDFKKKWQAYENGELTDKELKEFEKEIEKLEAYQKILDEPSEEDADSLSNKKQQKIIKKGKWKARISTAFTLFGLFVILLFLFTTLTAVYYSWGTPNKKTEYRAVIDHTLTVTNPYGYLGRTSTNTMPFSLEATRDIEKMVGKNRIKVGELNAKFIFSLMPSPERTDSYDQIPFSYPGSDAFNYSDWDQLEKLPEGTVASAYITFSELLESRDVEQLFDAKEMDLVWLAVDTGFESQYLERPIFDPIGFPSTPIWHENDFITQSKESSGGWLFGTESESSSSPEYVIGDQKMLHDQFMKTLYFLEDHKQKANLISYDFINIEERIAFLENNGILHYGAVITGPTKEILKLQDEALIQTLRIDEVAFWNWH